jgi:hypothetical protein
VGVVSLGDLYAMMMDPVHSQALIPHSGPGTPETVQGMAAEYPHGMPRIDRCGRQSESSSVGIASAVDKRFRIGARDLVAARQQYGISAF